MNRNFHLISIAVCAAALLGAVALASCATQAPDTQTRIDTAASVACAGVEAADTIFNTYAAAHQVSVEKREIAAQVYAGVHEICKPPYTGDLQTLVAKAVNATIAIMDAMKSPAP